MKIAILGTRGIPNYHGGFEQFAENFAVYLASKKHEVYVYNSHNHPYKKDAFNGVNIIHAYDPEYKVGTIGQFIYDLNCIRDTRKREFDAILQLGYTSNSIWHKLLPKNPIIFTNMDGLEWKRSKYSSKVRRFLKYAENLAVRSSDYLISDSIGIQDYLLKKYNKPSKFIAYGASVFSNPDNAILSEYNVKEREYCLIIARLEPENNIETIIRGYSESNVNYPLLVFGGLNKFGKKLKEKYKSDNRIRFVGSNYNQTSLNNLRYFSRYYFHGHSVGGTNPSLLEAMASNTLIIANNNVFNKSILENHALYFNNPKDITNFLEDDRLFDLKEKFSVYNKEKIQSLYTWEKINAEYESFIIDKIKS